MNIIFDAKIRRKLKMMILKKSSFHNPITEFS